MENLREDVQAEFAFDPNIDAEGFTVDVEQNLFVDDDTVTPFQRSAPVDENLFAAFVARQIQIADINEKLEIVENLIVRIQKRLTLAKSDNTKRLSKELYSAALTKLVELIGSKKLNKTGRKQLLHEQRKQLASERDAAIESDKSAIWAMWFKLEEDEKDPQEWLNEFNEKPVVDFFDPEDIDNRSIMSDRQVQYDDMALAHIREQRAGEGLFYEDQAPLREVKTIGRGWYNYGTEYRMKQEANRKNANDEAFEALLRDAE